MKVCSILCFFFSSRRRHTRCGRDWSSDVCSSDLVGCIVLVVVVYAVAGLGALAALMAPVLLGPSPTERIAALEARAVHLAERNRLARELHDSVGHALTVTTRSEERRV